MERVYVFILYFCLCIAAEAAQTHNVTTDQSALLALKSRITSDPQNMISTNWSSATPVCSWVGITCSKRHLRVTVIELSYFDLTGTIPPELGNLSFLEEMAFRNNSFSGTFPEELARLHRLSFINFGYNNLKGTIPTWFGSFRKLQALYLYSNQFSGSIPTSISNLSALLVLDLDNNLLSGSIPREIGNLTMLVEIDLYSNNFKGEIPKEIGTLDQLQVLNLQYNVLTGPVPVGLFNMSALFGMGLTENSFNGSLPDNLCQHLPSIEGFYLARNQFDGPLPSKSWQYCTQLLILALTDNHFSGNIPKTIQNATQLTEIFLGYNNLAGTLPHEIGAITNLEAISVPACNLHGNLPSTIFNMSKITLLSFTNNQFSGRLPKYIGNGVPNLLDFTVARNRFSGVIPNFIYNASQITTLDMSSNSFSGFVPSTLCALANLDWLNLQNNSLSIDTSTPEANFLSCLASLRNLTNLYLADNALNTTFHVSSGNLSSSLRVLDLRNCSLKGNIPNEIGNLSSLKFLHLDGNQLGGSIPSSIGRLLNLQRLYLSSNKLQGQIPDELCQLNNLAEVYLDGNQLIGPIPSCLGHLEAALRRLSLGSNLLNSIIPSSLWDLKYILYLNLSSNSLIGSIPEGIGNLKVAIDVDFSNNQFSGVIPSGIGGLQDLVTLFLENNSLEGSIPSSLGKTLSLESLDVSQNKLSGVIPNSLESLSHLKYLNLSYNRLQGEIPAGGPFRNFSAQSFVSSGKVCGAPRLHLPSCKASRSILKYIIPAILSAMLLVTIICICMVILRRKRSNVQAAAETAQPLLPLRKVSYLQLQRATNGFADSNLLGAGSFGSVYKGTLSDGTDIAIKVYSLREGAFKSFDIECEMLRNIRHRNLIKIISCCSQTDFKAMILEYMPNGDLNKWLHSPNLSLNILQRLNIMIEVASALEYLHHGCEVPIVHCDLKPSNILLDHEMGAHVTDFGIAKLLGGGDSITQTITLATIGYMAPEYGMEGFVSTRGDVYSFGIVLLETFTSRKPTDDMFDGDMSLRQWIANSLPESVADVVDANILKTLEDMGFVSKDCLTSIMRLALACSVESPEERTSMQEAVATLNKIKIKFLKGTAVG